MANAPNDLNRHTHRQKKNKTRIKRDKKTGMPSVEHSHNYSGSFSITPAIYLMWRTPLARPLHAALAAAAAVIRPLALLHTLQPPFTLSLTSGPMYNVHSLNYTQSSSLSSLPPMLPLLGFFTRNRAFNVLKVGCETLTLGFLGVFHCPTLGFYFYTVATLSASTVEPCCALIHRRRELFNIIIFIDANDLGCSVSVRVQI